MPDSIWTATLAAFRDRLASLEPVPAGVSAAAVSAIFGLGLLTKVLLVASRRKDFAGDRELVAKLLDDARGKSEILSRLADDDIQAFHQYLDSLRQKTAVDAAIRKVVDVPLQVARAAASGVDLCEAATGLIHDVVAPDLGTAAALLTAAVQSTLLTVKSNLQQLPDGDPYRVEVTAELTQLSLRFRADR